VVEPHGLTRPRSLELGASTRESPPPAAGNRDHLSLAPKPTATAYLWEGSRKRRPLTQFSASFPHRATYLSTAAGLEAKVHMLALQARQAFYNPPVQCALTNYSAYLQDFKQGTKQREDWIRRELDLYKVGGEPLKECARRYDVVAGGIEAVKGGIARLESEHPVPGRRSKA
jgi:hypothetical protein